MSNSFNENKLLWTDNKDIRARRKLNYDLNLRHHDRLNIPWKLIKNERINEQDQPLGVKFNNQESGQSNQNSDEQQFLKDKPRCSLNQRLLVQRLNPYLQIIAVITIIIFAVLIFCLLLDGEDSNKVSNCFLKFKQLNCSVVRPNDECKAYLECLQKLENGNSQGGEGLKYYFGIVGGFIGFLLKRYIMKIFT